MLLCKNLMLLGQNWNFDTVKCTKKLVSKYPKKYSTLCEFSFVLPTQPLSNYSSKSNKQNKKKKKNKLKGRNKIINHKKMNKKLLLFIKHRTNQVKRRKGEKLIRMLNRVIHMSHACYFFFDIFIQENKIVGN